MAANRAEQKAKLAENWSKFGREMDFDDIPDRTWFKEANAWDKAHGTNLVERANSGERWEGDPRFDAHLQSAYLDGNRAPFPGVRAANEYFSDNDEWQHAVYVRGEEPEE